MKENQLRGENDEASLEGLVLEPDPVGPGGLLGVAGASLSFVTKS